MQEVGHHLQVYAHNLIGSERDNFARSAYNRYYYGCFLRVRSLFQSINSDWSGSAHKNYPEILRGSLARKFKYERRLAEKRGDEELERQLQAAIRALPEMASIMELAYATRVVADYEPSLFVSFDSSSRFSLNSVEIERAHLWKGKIDTLCATVQSAWQQING